MYHQTCISCDKKYEKWQIELKIAIIVIVSHNIFKPNIYITQYTWKNLYFHLKENKIN
jgi:hypothetical protein